VTVTKKKEARLANSSRQVPKQDTWGSDPRQYFLLKSRNPQNSSIRR
jgi:hypothetical protein